MGWPTAQSVLAQAAVELGLVSSPDALGDNAYDSVDTNIIQLRTFLKKVGRGLVDEYGWEQLRAEWSITTLASRLGAFALPSDFAAMIDQSGWNRTTRLPMGGPLSEQEWQYLASRLTGVVWTVLFRPMQGLLWVYPPTGFSTQQAITFAYKSRNWVRPDELVEGTDYTTWAPDADFNIGALVAGCEEANGLLLPLPFITNIYRCAQPGLTDAAGSGPDAALLSSGVPTVSGSILDGACYWNWIGTVIQRVDAIGQNAKQEPTFATKDEVAAGSDVLLFDEQLLVAGLKYEWLNGKGFDSSVAWDDFQSILNRSKDTNSSSPILSLNGTGMVRDRLLGDLNVPITGFGS